MGKRPNLADLIVAATFGIIGVWGLASGRTELLAFLVLAVTFLIIGSNDNGKRTQRKNWTDR